MAMCIRSLTKCSINLLGKHLVKQLVFNATRQLYSPSSMGINGYLNARDYVKSQFVNVDHLFYQKMRDFVGKEDDSMIFTEDLKTMLHLVEKKPEDLELLYKMMKKFHNQNNLRFGSFIFGTVAMRAFYFLDEPDLALKAFKDPELTNFFDQLMSYQLLMDLLYNHGRYSDVRQVYDMVKTKNLNGIVHPRNPFILVMGACYKENTKESYNYGVELFKEVQARGFDIPRRGITFLGALALNQNDPNTALEIASLARNVRYIDIRCIKLKAYAILGRSDEMMVYFRDTLQNDMPTRRKQMYFLDTIEEVEKYVAKEKLDETHDLVKLLRQIKLHDYVQTGTMDEHICAPIEVVKYTDQKPWEKREEQNEYKRDNFQGYTYRPSSRNVQNRYNERSGLRDMV